ncbi:hypothetical protein GCM10027073_23300 [Streptomyces chlorus]
MTRPPGSRPMWAEAHVDAPVCPISLPLGLTFTSMPIHGVSAMDQTPAIGVQGDRRPHLSNFAAVLEVIPMPTIEEVVRTAYSVSVEELKA